MLHQVLSPQQSRYPKLTVDTYAEVLVPKPVKVLSSPVRTKAAPSCWSPSLGLSNNEQSAYQSSTLQKPQTASPVPQPKAQRNLFSNSLEIAADEIQNILVKRASAEFISQGNESRIRTPLSESLAYEEDEEFEDPLFEVDYEEVTVISEEDLCDLRSHNSVKVFGYDDEEERDIGSNSHSHCLTPPTRSDNPMCFDSRFFGSEHFGISPKTEFEGAELGLFNFSPPLCSSH